MLTFHKLFLDLVLSVNPIAIYQRERLGIRAASRRRRRGFVP